MEDRLRYRSYRNKKVRKQYMQRVNELEHKRKADAKRRAAERVIEEEKQSKLEEELDAGIQLTDNGDSTEGTETDSGGGEE